MNERKSSWLLRAGALLLAALMLFGNLYLPSGVFAVSAAEAGANTLPLQEDFQEAAVNSSGPFVIDGPGASGTVATVTEADGNKLLQVSRTDKTNHGYVTWFFKDASNKHIDYIDTPVYLSYWFSVSGQGEAILPSLASHKGTSAPGIYYKLKKDGSFEYSTNLSSWTPACYKDSDEPVLVTYNDWILVEQVYTCGATETMTMKINGREVEVTPADRARINCVSIFASSYTGTDQILSVDNMTVTETAHTPMTDPSIVPTTGLSFVDAGGQTITALKVGISTPTVLSLAFTPENATDKEVTLVSSNPAVADFVDGKLVGYKAGNTTVTATLNSNSTVTAQLIVTVDTSAEGLPIQEDFINATLDTSGGFIVNAPAGSNADATVCQNSAGNKMLVVSNKGGTAHGYAVLPFLNAAGETVSYDGTVHLSYWMAVSTTGEFNIPTLAVHGAGGTYLTPNIMLTRGSIMQYSANRADWVPIQYKTNSENVTYLPNQWIKVEQIYTCSETEGQQMMSMWINDQEVVLDINYIPCRSSVNSVAMMLSNSMRDANYNPQFCYVDNITVTAGDAVHTAMPMPEGDFTVATTGVGFVDADGQAIDALTVIVSVPTQLNVAFEPLYASDWNVTFTSSDPTVADFDADGKLVGYKEGETTVTVTLNNETEISAQLTVTVVAYDDVLPILEDFENATEGTGGPFAITGSEDAYGYVYEKNNGNMLLQVSNTDTQEHGYATLWFRDKTDQQVCYNGTLYLSYWLAADSTGIFYIPTFSSYTKDNDLGAYVALWSNGTFRYSTDRTNWTNVTYKEDGDTVTYSVHEWIKIEQVYTCGANSSMTMKINGKEVVVEGIGRSTVNCISMYMSKWMEGQVAYMDNMTVTMLPHEPMAKPDSNLVVPTAGMSFVDADGQEIDKLTISAQVPTKLNVIFDPLGASDRDVTITSSKPNVADFNDDGRLVGYEEGETTITVTLDNNAEIFAKLTVTVDIMDVEEVTITKVDLDAVAGKEDTYAMVVGGHGFATAVVAPDTADYKTVKWTSSNPEVATVDSYGEILALSAGTTVITAATAQPNSTVCDTITVVVTKAEVAKTFSVSSVDQLKEALEKVADINANGGMTGNIEIVLADGYYYLTETLKIGPEHSGTNGYSVIIKAADDAEPVISGATVITGQWTKVEGKDYYSIQVPKDVDSRHLFVNNVRAVRARSNSGLTNSRFIYDANGINIGYVCDDVYLASYKYPQDLEMVFFVEWTQPRCGVTQIVNNGDGTVNLIMDQPGWSGVGRTGQSVSNKGGTSAKAHGPAWIENALELLDESGEWYLDTHSNDAYNILYYMPRPFEDLTTAKVTMPTLDNSTDIEGADGALVSISGTFSDAAHNQVATQVMNIHFEGITFADTTWMRPGTNKGHADAQNNYLREGTSTNDKLTPGAVLVEAANSIWFTGCTFTRLGINGLQMINGVQNSLIIGNHFFDISGNAINIGEPDTDAANANAQGLNLIKNNDIFNNLIHDIGVDFGSSAAISVGYAAEMDMSHNELFNLPYSGWHIGYGWASTFPSNTKNMLLEYNFIHDIMGGEIFDGGAIYTIGNTSGEGYNYIRRNYVRNQMNQTAALYSDSGSTYFKYIENVVDLSETTDWHSSSARWAYSGEAAQHIHYIGNFVTNDYYTFSFYADLVKDDLSFENSVLSPDASWTDSIALDVIANAGLEDAYSYLRDGQVERIKVKANDVVYSGEDMYLKVGDTVQLSFTASALRGAEEITSGLNYHYYYESRDPAIAQVDENGLIVTKSSGITAVRLVVVSNKVVEVKEINLIIGDVAASVVLEDVDGDISFRADADGLQLTAVVTSSLGFERTPDALIFGVADKSVATVTAEGYLAPVSVGTTSLTVAATYGGVTVASVYKVVIKTPAVIKESNASDMFAQNLEDGWIRSDAYQWAVVDGTSVNVKLNSYATFSGTKYDNELLCFNLKIDKVGISSNWPSIVLRAQNSSGEAQAGDTDGYVFCMGSNGIEVYRFVNGVRYVIRGNQADDGSSVIRLSGAQGVINPEVSGFTYTDDVAEHNIKVGAIADGDYVRILMYVNGNKVLDYLDTAASGAISAPGYFGMIGRGQKFTLTKNTSISDDTGDGEGDDAIDTEGKAAQIGTTMYDTVEEALAAAKVAESSVTVKLLADAEFENLLLVNDVILDLNGNNLTAKYLVAFGRSGIIDSAPGVGLLKCENVRLAADNPAMPVWDEAADGYLLFTMKSQQKYLEQTADGYTFAARPLLGNEANNVFMSQSETNGLTIKIRLNWTSNSGRGVEQFFILNPKDMTTIYSQTGKVIQLNVTGAGAFATRLYTTCYIESETGVIWAPAGRQYRGK